MCLPSAQKNLFGTIQDSRTTENLTSKSGVGVGVQRQLSRAPLRFPRPPAEFGFALFVWSNLPIANVDVKLIIILHLMLSLAIGKFDAKKGQQ
jgi:hypothetical protein